MYQCKKGFTLIELMIVVMVIGISSAVAIPQFIMAKANKMADDMIKSNNYRELNTIKNDTSKRIILERLYKKGIDIKTLGFDIKDGTVVKVAKRSQDNNTVNPVLNEQQTPQKDNNTVNTVFIPNVVVTCQDRDGLLSRCTMNINQNDQRYLLPLNCERTNKINEWKCERF